jgi:uncharacterized protein (TIGR03435 family)
MTAISILVKVTFMLALALAAVHAARRSRAAVRHVVLASVFGALFALPLAAIVTPTIRVPVMMPAPAQTVVLSLDEFEGRATPPINVGASPAATSGVTWRRPAAALTGLWSIGALLFVLPVIVGLWQVRSLRRTGTPWPDGLSIVQRLAGDAAVQRPLSVLLHDAVSGPMTCGAFRPAIVLPADAPRWPIEDLHRAIVHELEHVRRVDWLTHCVARVVCAAYWFHPLVWIAWHRLVLEAERACDDAVLHRGEAADYADQLVGLAERLSEVRHQPLLAMANRTDLAARVRAVLDRHQARGPAGALAIRIAAGLAALAVTAMSPLRIAAAEPFQPSDGARFAVVSVKPCENEPPTPPGQRSSQGGFPTVSPGRFTIECGTVERLISHAYVLNGEPLSNQQARIGNMDWLKNAPSWVRTEKFTIEAKADGTPDRAVLLGPMLRALLEDRFKLRLHRESDEQPIYLMTLVKGGLKIQPIGEDGCTPLEAAERSPDRMRLLTDTDKPVCGNMNMTRSDGQRRWVIGGTTMPNFSGTLSAFLDHHVVDRTGVEGKFNVRLVFMADEHVPGPDRRAGAPPPPPPGDGPNIFAALEQQLGLKLEQTRGPHGFLVIDHVERPSPNGGQ